VLIILSAGRVCVHEIPTWNTIAKEALLNSLKLLAVQAAAATAIRADS
jgi:hypothetical protein